MLIKRIFYIIILLLGWQVSALAQYGYEWIKPYQPYYKFKVASTGVYTIDSALLASNGIILSGVNPNRFQLFRNGIEQVMYVSGQIDGVFNQNDQIEFLGEPNDGKLDSQLYAQPSDQPHQWASLYSDTAVYFFTILPDTTMVVAKRFALNTSSNFNSFSSETYFMHEAKVFPTAEYVEGINLNPGGEKYNSSEYTDGEGWAAARIGLTESQTWEFNTPNYAAVPVQPNIETKVIGVSDYVFGNPPNNHHVRYSIAKFETQSYSTVTDIIYKGYVSKKYTGALSQTNFGANKTLVKVDIINDLSVASDFNCLSYIKLNYPRLYNLNGEAALGLTVLHTQGGGRSRLSFANYGSGQTNPRAYDFTTGQRVTGAMNGGVAEILVDNPSNPSRVYVFDSTQTKPILSIKAVSFTIINASNAYDFIVVTSPVLDVAASNYVNYRSQKFSMLKVFSEDLYDFYTYGYSHPLAVKRLASHLLKESTHKPQYMLLLGKGYQGNLLKNASYASRNLVPAIGVPASDVMFSAGIVGAGFTNDIPTGRIPAANNEELQYYLDKLIDYETKPDSILAWRKNILHISGGNDLSQQTQFKNQLAQNAQTIKGKNYGGNVISYNKDNSEEVSIDVKQDLIRTIDNGVTMLTFLGHGSATILDVDFGGIDDINNQNKYAFFYFNGCNIGNPSDVDPSSSNTGLYGKDFICANGKGAIGWLAHSNITLDGRLYAQMNSFYSKFCLQNYSEPIGKIIKAASEAIASPDEQLRSHSYQLTLMGDPATRIYSPVKPDYAIESSSLYMDPANANAQLDSVKIGIICTNLGKAQDDTVTVQLTNILPNNVRKTYTSKFPGSIYFKDTLLIPIVVLKELSVGNNTFEVIIDEGNKLDEISKFNNSAQFSYYLPGNGIKALLPVESSIVTEDTVTLVIQNNDLRINSMEYLFEIDTTPYFNSSFLRQSGVVTSGAGCKWKVFLTAPDHTVYFWRARINVDPSKGGIWDTASFTLIRGGKKGWQQTHWGQYNHSQGDNIVIGLNQPVALTFVGNGLDVLSTQARWQHQNLGTFDPYYNNPGAGTCIGSGIVVEKYNGVSLAEDEVTGIPFNCTPGPPEYVYYAFDTKTQAGQDAFVNLINTADNGDFFALYSYYDAGIPGWGQPMRDALASIGSVKAASVTDFNTCFVLVGKKGEAPGNAVEDTITSLPGDTIKIISARRLLTGKWYKGDILSERIGPVQKWDSVSCNFNSIENAGTDRMYITVIAQDKQGKDTIIIPQTTTLIHNLSAIDAQKYPYLRIKMSFLDSAYRTPNQFGKWRVTYLPAAEGAISTQNNFVFYKQVIDQGDSLQVSFSFDNITDIPFDSVPVSFVITNANREVKYTFAESKAKLPGNRSVVIKRHIPTVNLAGLNTLNIAVNGEQQIPEVDLINNYLSFGFEVKTDQSSPVLDVTFDGYRIMSGDYVSPTPLIRLQSKDDNKFKIQDDTNTFVLFLKRPGKTDYERVYLSNPQVVFKKGNSTNNTASIEYRPERFADGKYSLKVQSVDASGNNAGSNSFEIEFSVVNESSITNFFPYPNPGTTNIRFVFTLTGSKAPEQLLIRIMTITGKVVKEITQNEFGPIKIGNNISEYGWDGTDNFGDRLANGVYLYQVMTKIDGQAIKKRDTSADQYVTHNTGKIYLLK